MRWFSLLFVVIVNAVPLVGIALLGWSASTVLVLFWFENLLIAACTCARIAVHRRLTRKRGHWRTNQLGLKINDKPSNMGLLDEYKSAAFSFTLVHGLFVGGIVLMTHENFAHDAAWQFSSVQFLQGAGWLIAVLGLQLVIDLSRIRSLSYAAIKSNVQTQMGRVIVLHLTIIFGMFAMLATGKAFAILTC